MTGRKKANEEIRDAAREKGLLLWEVAELLGIGPEKLSLKLRHELPADERERILHVIREAGNGAA